MSAAPVQEVPRLPAMKRDLLPRGLAGEIIEALSEFEEPLKAAAGDLRRNGRLPEGPSQDPVGTAPFRIMD